ncbi:zinc finger protein 583-like isoform X2 [Ambystoma mexicanum]|uniref:zinc finger protein 583-like isoform X2 n=1 Tax=Ambystoma mexicanum TaxID=8296 RepID=UPI0037E7CE05
MLSRGPEKVQVTFQDVAARFSDEEWKLLHEWQNELYKHVMKEIQQALIALGSSIATSVFSLRAKEKEDLPCTGRTYFERRPCATHSASGSTEHSDIVFTIHGKQTEYLTDSLAAHTEESNEYLHSDNAVTPSIVSFSIKEDCETYPIEHQDADRQESIHSFTDTTLIDALSIKEEANTFCLDHHGSDLRGSFVSAVGNESMSRKNNSGNPLKCSKKNLPCKAFTEKNSTLVFQSSNQEANFQSHMRFESGQEIGAEMHCPSESHFSDTVNSNLQAGNPVIGRSGRYDECEGNLKNSLLPDDQSNQQQNQRTYTFTAVDSSHCLKKGFSRNVRTNSRERSYACSECEKSFFWKSHLLMHHRIHSGEKPFMCTFCQKRFNRKSTLDQHIRIHTGEKPYKCAKCEKDFIRKGDLRYHQRTHTQQIKNNHLRYRANRK